MDKEDGVCVCVCTQLLSCVLLFVTPWTIACQAPLSMGFFQAKSRSGLPFPPPGNLPDPEIKPVSPAFSGRFFTTESPKKPYTMEYHCHRKL